MMAYKPDPEVGLAVQGGLIKILERQNVELQAQLEAQKERADYAWRNTNTIERARQEEMAKRDALLIDLAASLKREDELKQQRDEQAARIAELEAELERERIRLAACGSAALGFFEGCKDEYYSASLGDVLRLRENLAALRRKIDEAPVEAWSHNCSDNSDVEFFTVSLESDHPLAVHNGSHPLISKEDLQK